MIIIIAILIFVERQTKSDCDQNKILQD